MRPFNADEVAATNTAPPPALSDGAPISSTGSGEDKSDGAQIPSVVVPHQDLIDKVTAHQAKGFPYDDGPSPAVLRTIEKADFYIIHDKAQFSPDESVAGDRLWNENYSPGHPCDPNRAPNLVDDRCATAESHKPVCLTYSIWAMVWLDIRQNDPELFVSQKDPFEDKRNNNYDPSYNYDFDYKSLTHNLLLYIANIAAPERISVNEFYRRAYALCMDNHFFSAEGGARPVISSPAGIRRLGGSGAQGSGGAVQDATTSTEPPDPA